MNRRFLNPFILHLINVKLDVCRKPGMGCKMGEGIRLRNTGQGQNEGLKRASSKSRGTIK